MDRRTLDVAVPMVFGGLVAVLFLLDVGKAAYVVAVIGGVLVGLYYAALRQKLPSGSARDDE